MSLETRIEKMETRIGGAGAYPAYIRVKIEDPLESEEAQAAIAEAVEKAKATGGGCHDPSIVIKGPEFYAIAALDGDAVEVRQIIRGIEV